MKILPFFILIFSISFNTFSQQDKVDSLLHSKKLRFLAIDSCGQSKAFLKSDTFHIYFYKFSDGKIKLNRFDRYVKRKKYYTGIFRVINLEKDHYSIHYCNVKGYYKLEGKNIVLFWDDNFKVQEHFNEFSNDPSLWFLVSTNAKGYIEIKEDNSIHLAMKNRTYKNEPICLTLVINLE